jgi:MoaA/NifB/PqqE/SkfB family radical SAM enzyme
LGRTIELQISGGEPTVYPDFAKLLDYCQQQNIKVQIITNGSRTLNWWKNNADKLEFVCFSLHYTCHDWVNFRQVVDYVSSIKKVHVNVVMDLDNFDLQYSRAKELQKNSQISINLKPVRKNFSSELYDYTTDQLDLMNNFKHIGQPLTANLARRGQIVNEQSISLNQSHLILNNQNQYLDWQCYGGLEYVVIDQYGNIYTSQCRQKPLGNIQDSQINWPTQPQTCLKKSCFCSSDLFLTKFSKD